MKYGPGLRAVGGCRGSLERSQGRSHPLPRRSTRKCKGAGRATSPRCRPRPRPRPRLGPPLEGPASARREPGVLRLRLSVLVTQVSGPLRLPRTPRLCLHLHAHQPLEGAPFTENTEARGLGGANPTPAHPGQEAPAGVPQIPALTPGTPHWPAGPPRPASLFLFLLALRSADAAGLGARRQAGSSRLCL